MKNQKTLKNVLILTPGQEGQGLDPARSLLDLMNLSNLKKNFF